MRALECPIRQDVQTIRLCKGLQGPEPSSVYGADLRSAVLSSANLPFAILTRANLREANLSGANLTGADLTGADLTGANLSGTQFCRTTMPDSSINTTPDGCNVDADPRWSPAPDNDHWVNLRNVAGGGAGWGALNMR
ncbi:MAG: pentapeptide repeat-containing protein [Chloroflexi bacterium]|nr:pentapeptide repeat-containing protein [Chloroflexota bacterium]